MSRKNTNKNGGIRKQVGHKTKSKTLKYKRVNQTQFDMLIKKMLELLTLLRLYHWNTLSYATHKATGDLYDGLSDKVDEYVETMIGKSDSKYRINMSNYKRLVIHGVSNNSEMEKTIKTFISQLVYFHSHLPQTFYSDINNIKDEIVGSLNKYLYLLSLK